MYKKLTITAVIIIGFILLIIFIPKNTSAPGTEQQGQGLAFFTQDEVAAHATESDCYSIVGGEVYELTDWIARHPGGAQDIIDMCGVDATESYDEVHGNKKGTYSSLEKFKIGTIAE